MNGMSSNRWDKVYNYFKGKRFSVWKEDITPFLEEKVGENSFISHGIFHHFYSLDEVKNLLSLFKLLEIRKIRHQDPSHVADYPRSKRHTHDSIYVLCNKP